MKRFEIYLIVGLIFGVLDWYYLDGLAHFPWGSFGESFFVVPVILLMNYGIWLIPIVPVAWLESRASHQMLYPVLAGVLTWCSAIFSYYAYYTFLFALGRLPNLESLIIFGERYPGFWNDWWAVFQKIILNQFFEWIIIAVIGGGTIGVLFHLLSQVLSRRRVPDV